MNTSEVIKIAFIGVSGSGKGSTIDILLGGNGDDLQCTQQFFDGSLKIEPTIVEKKDTVAVNDSINAEKLASTPCVDFEKLDPYRKNCQLYIIFERIHDLKYIIDRHPKEFHLFVLIYPHTEEMETKPKKFLKKVISMFGEAFFDRCILVVTKCSDEPQTYMKQIEAIHSKDMHFEKLFQKGNFLICPRKGLEKDAEYYQDFRKSFAAKIMNIIFNCFTPNTAFNSSQMDSNSSYLCTPS